MEYFSFSQHKGCAPAEPCGPWQPTDFCLWATMKYTNICWVPGLKGLKIMVKLHFLFLEHSHEHA